jgi:hypothetical protein
MSEYTVPTNELASSTAVETLPSVEGVAIKYLVEARDGVNNYALPDGVGNLLSELSSSVTEIITASSAGALKARELQRDDTIYPAGRDRLVRETIADAKSKVETLTTAFDVRYAVAEADLYEAARPKVGRHEQAAARQDAVMLLDGMLNRPNVNTSTVLQRLAGRQDAVGALVSSDWLRDYALSKGMDQDVIDAASVLMRQAALEGAAASGDRDRANAAKAALNLRAMRQAHTSAAAYARLALR